MQTLAKVLLLVFWLIGAGTGGVPPDAPSARDDIAYHIALFDGADLQVQPHRVTVEVSSAWSTDAVAISAAVPAWVTGLSARMHAPSGALPATAASEAAAASTAPAATDGVAPADAPAPASPSRP